MKIIVFLFLIVSITLNAQNNYVDSIQKIRDQHQIDFPKEVLNTEERSHFDGICYFPIDTSYIVKAEFKRVKGKKFAMPMSKERLVFYKQYGTLTFKVHDTLCTLIVYENLDLKGLKEYKNYLFLPFKDGTTSLSTYGAGRYLDITKTKGNTWTIDFNLAYHPYCAYSDRYSCPIVPSENSVNPNIMAGECYIQHD